MYQCITSEEKCEKLKNAKMKLFWQANENSVKTKVYICKPWSDDRFKRNTYIETKLFGKQVRIWKGILKIEIQELFSTNTSETALQELCAVKKWSGYSLCA